MQTKDHLSLAKYIVRTANSKRRSISLTHRAAFVFGCIEPDINMFSYIKGSLSNRPLTGHNYECSSAYMQKILEALSLKSNWTVSDYFLFGRFTHYATDAFTYPHNNIFPGTIREHSDFEARLHHRFSRYLHYHGKKGMHRVPLVRLSDFISKFHSEYLQKCGNIETDCIYIADIINTITCSIPCESVLLTKLARQSEN